MKVILGVLTLTTLSFASTAPNFQGKTLEGKTIQLSESLKTDRALLLCFWATWCAPCLQELKMLSKEIAEHPDVPLDILAVNVDRAETLSDVRSVSKLHKISFEILLDTQQDILSKFHADRSLPFSVLLDSKGRILEKFDGLDKQMFTKIQTAIPKAHGKS